MTHASWVVDTASKSHQPQKCTSETTRHHITEALARKTLESDRYLSICQVYENFEPGVSSIRPDIRGACAANRKTVVFGDLRLYISLVLQVVEYSVNFGWIVYHNQGRVFEARAEPGLALGYTELEALASHLVFTFSPCLTLVLWGWREHVEFAHMVQGTARHNYTSQTCK